MLRFFWMHINIIIILDSMKNTLFCISMMQYFPPRKQFCPAHDLHTHMCLIPGLSAGKRDPLPLSFFSFSSFCIHIHPLYHLLCVPDHSLFCPKNNHYQEHWVPGVRSNLSETETETLHTWYDNVFFETKSKIWPKNKKKTWKYNLY